MSTPDTRQPGSAPPPKDLLASPDRPLAGKKFVLTGGSSDIGGEITKAVSASGGSLVTCYRKDRNVQAIQTNISGENYGEVLFVKANIETAQGRNPFIEAAVNASRKTGIDGLILNTFLAPSKELIQSSDHPIDLTQLNVDASMHLVDGLLDSMNEGGAIVRIQSVAGFYQPQIPDEDLYGYLPVAIAKYLEHQALRARRSEFRKKGVRLITIVPPVVPETKNARHFNREILEATGNRMGLIDMHDIFSHKLGIPTVIEQKVVAETLVRLLSNPNIPDGYVELFGPQDLQMSLEHWYGTDQVYVQTLERLPEVDGRKRGIVRALVSRAQAERANDPPMITEIDGNIGTVAATSDRALGHLKSVEIIPGHKELRAAVNLTGLIENQSGKPGFAQLRSAESVSFTDAVVADGISTLHVVSKPGSIEVVKERAGKITTASQVSGLNIAMVENDGRGYLLEDQMIEGAAQAVGVTHLETIDPESMPLFLGIGKIEFSGARPKAGDGVEYHVETTAIKRYFSGNVEIWSSGQLIGKISDITARAVPKDNFNRMLGIGKP